MFNYGRCYTMLHSHVLLIYFYWQLITDYNSYYVHNCKYYMTNNYFIHIVAELSTNMRDSYRCLVSSHPGTVMPGSDKHMLLLLLHRCSNCIFRKKL